MRHNSTLPLIALILLALLGSANTLRCGFTYDDLPLIEEAAVIRFHPHAITYLAGRHLRAFTLVMDMFFWGGNPFGYHLTNILLHVLCSLLLFTYLVDLGGGRRISFLLTAFFAVHPVFSEVVASIAHRKEQLLLLFSLLFLLLARRPVIKLHLFAAVSFFLALLSKAPAIVLPFILYLQLRFLPREGQLKKGGAYCLMAVSAIAGLGLLYLFSYTTARGYIPEVFDRLPYWSVLLTVPSTVARYILVFLFPIGLHIEYAPYYKVTLWNTETLFLIAIASYVCGVLIMKGIPPRTRFGLLWFAISLLPALNLLPGAYMFAYRYLYLPAVGLLICISGFSSRGDGFVKTRRYSRACTVAGAILLTSFLLGMVKRNTAWENNLSLWTDASIKLPNYPKAALNLGLAYLEEGRFREAIGAFKRFDQLSPHSNSARIPLGDAYRELGYFDDAIRTYQKALGNEEIPGQALGGLARTYELMGDPEKAGDYYTLALKKNPASGDLHLAYGIFLAKGSRFTLALDHLSRAVTLLPLSAQAHQGLSYVLGNLGQFDEAKKHCLRALSLKPAYAEAYNNLGNLLLREGNRNEAIMCYQRALAIKPGYQVTIDNLEKAH